MGKYKVDSFDLKLALLNYYRNQRNSLCVDEFEGADIFVDTGKEFIEVEVKITKSDLINGERKKVAKHRRYADGTPGGKYIWGQWYRPNKFLFCVPERLVDTALGFAAEINPKYGVIGFDVDTFGKEIQGGKVYWNSNNCFLRIAKSAKNIHGKYNEKLRWYIAKRASAKMVRLMEQRFDEWVLKKWIENSEVTDV